MKTLCVLFLIVFLGFMGLLAYQNSQDVTVNLLGQSREVSFPLLVGGTYGLGMFTGWSVVGILRRSWNRATERTEPASR